MEIALCSLHAQRRRTGLLAGILGIPLSIALLVPCIMLDLEALIYVVGAGFVGGILLLILWGRVVHIGRMDDRFVSLAAGRPFIDSLPSRDSWGYPLPGYPPPPGQWGPPQ